MAITLSNLHLLQPKGRYFRRIKTYQPLELKATFPHLIPGEYPSAWKGLEAIIHDIMNQSQIDAHSCLEFGVEFGYSTAVFANYFDEVTGVDLFTGDIHAGYKQGVFEIATENLKPFKNVSLIKNDYKDFIKDNNNQFDLIHVDIIHSYEATYDCGLWSAQHSKCTLFHDTESFLSVKRAVCDIAKKTRKSFYNYPYFNGLGILY